MCRLSLVGLVAVLLTGCETRPSDALVATRESRLLDVGDSEPDFLIWFDDVLVVTTKTGSGGRAELVAKVPADGSIYFFGLDKVFVLGKRSGELETELERRYASRGLADTVVGISRGPSNLEVPEFSANQSFLEPLVRFVPPFSDDHRD